METQSYAKIDTWVVIQAMENYLKINAQKRIEMRKEAVEAARVYKWWGIQRGRTLEQAEQHIQFVESQQKYWESPYHGQAEWLHYGEGGLFGVNYCGLARQLLKLAQNTSKDYVYLTASDNDFVIMYKDNE